MEKTWWKEYRRTKYKVRKRLNLEKIARKSFIENVRECGKNLSLAGTQRLFDDNISFPVKIFLCIVYTGVIVFFGIYLYTVWTGLSRPLIVTMESSTYPISEIDFPAVAICNVNKMSKRNVNAFTERLMVYLEDEYTDDNQTLQEIKRELTKSHLLNVFIEMGRLLDFEYSEAIENDPLAHFDQKGNFNTHAIIELMLEFAPNCSEMLVKCAWQAEIINCNDYFVVRRTVLGHCCTFNYNRLFKEDGKPITDKRERHFQKNPGIINGLNVILDPQVDDYAYPIKHIKGYDLLLFDALQYADFTANVVHRFVELEQHNMIQLQSKVQYATEEVRKYSVETRKCLFHDERSEDFGDSYSYSACLIDCRIRAMQSLCKCTPYYYPVNEEDGPVCTLSELRCLNKYKEKLLYLYPKSPESEAGLGKEFQLGVSCPECYPDCEDTVHNSRSSKIPVTSEHPGMEKLFSSLFISGINMKNKCALSIYQTTSDGVLNRLDVVSYWYELLSSVGGFGGMLIGFSIISALEIIYFALIRYFNMFYSNFVKFY